MSNMNEGFGPDRGSSKKDFGKSAYPFPGGVVDLSNKHAVEQYLAKFNKGMADVENGLLHDKLLAGMAGAGDRAAGQKGYSVPSGPMDKAPARMTIKK